MNEYNTKNGDLTPEDVTENCGKRVWWYLPYDVPDDYPVEHLRGKHFDFEWKVPVKNRNRGAGCPYLTNSAVWKGFNDLATVNPELAKEWHPTKNGSLTAGDVTCNSLKKYGGKWSILMRKQENIVFLNGKQQYCIEVKVADVRIWLITKESCMWSNF